MTVFSVFIINKAGSLIYDYENPSVNRPAVEKTFSFPLELVLKVFDEKVVVSFGERDGIKVGHAILSINGISAKGKLLEDGRDIMETLASEANYPINIKFGKPHLKTNEKIMLASMFHSLFAFGSQLSPETNSSGIHTMETDSFKLHCHQTLTGVKFVILTDPRQAHVDSILKKLYEVYSDYALKNPFYSLDMPVRGDLFLHNLQQVIDQVDKMGLSGI